MCWGRRQCARLTHPGIVTIHDVLESEGSVYIVMEHLPGASLELLHKFPRLSSFEAKVGILIRILEALHYAHGRGVVHRDVKPRNVQVLPDGSVKLLDFGIAHVAGVDALTATGMVTGTAYYASPEQLRGEESGPGTDVYSTGILAYEILTRRHPFDGDSVAAVVAKCCRIRCRRWQRRGASPFRKSNTSSSGRRPNVSRTVTPTPRT